MASMLNATVWHAPTILICYGIVSLAQHDTTRLATTIIGKWQDIRLSHSQRSQHRKQAHPSTDGETKAKRQKKKNHRTGGGMDTKLT